MAENEEKVKKPIYKKWWFWVILIFIIFLLLCIQLVTTTISTLFSDENALKLSNEIRDYNDNFYIYTSVNKNDFLIQAKFNNNEDFLKHIEKINEIVSKYSDYLSLYNSVDLEVFTLDGYKCIYNFNSKTFELNEDSVEEWSLNSNLNTKLEEQQNKITELEDNHQLLQQEKETLQNKITELETNNQTLQQEKESLQNEKQQLENEKNELNTKIKESQKTSSTKSTSSTTSSSTSSNSQSNNSNSTTTTKSISSQNSNTSSDNNSEMVWIGETGNKYHNQSCRTLKGNGHQITKKQALSEGRQACKICH